MARGDLNASVRDQGQRGSALNDTSLDTAVMRVIKNKLGLDDSDMQTLQRMVGKRFSPGEQVARPGAAVRRGDFSILANVKAMKSQPLTAAPTATDYNNLRADLLQIFQALQAIAVIFADFSQSNG